MKTAKLKIKTRIHNNSLPFEFLLISHQAFISAEEKFSSSPVSRVGSKDVSFMQRFKNSYEFIIFLEEG